MKKHVFWLLPLLMLPVGFLFWRLEPDPLTLDVGDYVPDTRLQYSKNWKFEGGPLGRSTYGYRIGPLNRLVQYELGNYSVIAAKYLEVRLDDKELTLTDTIIPPINQNELLFLDSVLQKAGFRLQEPFEELKAVKTETGELLFGYFNCYSGDFLFGNFINCYKGHRGVLFRYERKERSLYQKVLFRLTDSEPLFLEEEVELGTLETFYEEPLLIEEDSLKK